MIWHGSKWVERHLLLKPPSFRLPWLVSLALSSLMVSCGKSQGVSVENASHGIGNSRNPGVDKVLGGSCLEPDKVLVGVQYTCPDGRSLKGTLSVGIGGHSVPACAKDNELGCVTSESFPSIPSAERAKIVPGHIKQGIVIAGVSGSLTPLGPSDCAVDGEVGCVATSAFPAAGADGLEDKVLAGKRVAGFAGNVLLPAASSVRFGATFGSHGGLQGTLMDCTVDGASGCVATDTHRAAEVLGLESKVISSASVAGVTGTVVLPAASDVRIGVTYGASLASQGTYAPDFPDVENVRSRDTVNGVEGTLADCNVDGAVGCVVPSGGTLKAAETSNFNGWDIRKKRNSNGAVLSFAGVVGQNKTCRNRANRGVFNNTAPPAVNAGIGDGEPDVFDTIDDNNGAGVGIPLEVPQWLTFINGNSLSLASDFACGGIFSTGDVATGFTGADGTLPHDANGNWQDLTPGVRPGGAQSANSSNGCNASDKHCVFRELISGLMVTEIASSTFNWEGAISYCDNLGGGGESNKIPVIGGMGYDDWRLPTQKELMHLYNAGIRGLNQTSDLKLFFGSVDLQFWSSSTVSDTPAEAWNMNLHKGGTGQYAKLNTRRVLCVRE